jgi:hypothetical protein
MSSINHGQISRLTKEIAELRKLDAREAGKEADLLAKINRANEAASHTRSASTLQSKMREVERSTKDLAAVRKKRADIARKIADKAKNLHSYEERQARDDEKAGKKVAQEHKRLIREREAHERRLSSEIRSLAAAQVKVAPALEESHDFFISHASEDKDGLVRELAEALRTKGARVWYDEFTLRIGDSLRRNIDQGLANSRFWRRRPLGALL